MKQKDEIDENAAPLRSHSSRFAGEKCDVQASEHRVLLASALFLAALSGDARLFAFNPFFRGGVQGLRLYEGDLSPGPAFSLSAVAPRAI